MSGNLCSKYNDIKLEHFVAFCYDVLLTYSLDPAWPSWSSGCIGISLSLILKLPSA